MVAHRFAQSAGTSSSSATHSSRKIRCHIITVAADGESANARDESPRGARFRPSDLVPWADPYIAGLIHKLQDEVRREGRPAPAVKQGLGAPVADLEWPWEDRGEDYQPLPGDSSRDTRSWRPENRFDR